MTLCFPSFQSLPGSIAKAVGYLERQLPTLVNPYAVALASYALANENKLNRNILYKFAHQGDLTWPLFNQYHGLNPRTIRVIIKNGQMKT